MGEGKIKVMKTSIENEEDKRRKRKRLTTAIKKLIMSKNPEPEDPTRNEFFHCQPRRTGSSCSTDSDSSTDSSSSSDSALSPTSPDFSPASSSTLPFPLSPQPASSSQSSATSSSEPEYAARSGNCSFLRRKNRKKLSLKLSK